MPMLIEIEDVVFLQYRQYQRLIGIGRLIRGARFAVVFEVVMPARIELRPLILRHFLMSLRNNESAVRAFPEIHGQRVFKRAAGIGWIALREEITRLHFADDATMFFDDALRSRCLYRVRAARDESPHGERNACHTSAGGAAAHEPRTASRLRTRWRSSTRFNATTCHRAALRRGVLGRSSDSVGGLYQQRGLAGIVGTHVVADVGKK